MQNSHVDLTLSELLDANARFDLAAKGTTNHCPMALIALAKMGASPFRLREFFDMWEREYALPAPGGSPIIGRSEWSRHLGDTAAFAALRLCFLDWIAEDGAITVINGVLNEVPFAPASGAFHALIRIAYGIEAEHRGEIASGLAALVSSHLPIAVNINGSRCAESVDAAFSGAARVMGNDVVGGHSIAARLRAVADDVRFRQAIPAPPTSPSLLDDVARTTIAAYWRTSDFTVLHTVTATHAARILFAQLPDSLVIHLLSGLWIALCAAFAIVRRPENLESCAPNVDSGWNEICRKAVLSNDDHVIKMTYTCFCEDRRHPSPLYRASAARLVGLA
ncbi:MAG TPA: questin oxidase family protein [Trinickia sp.]|uniref:questin oxidase family protein n=1 Tax=Trinickia sp. TaxID=2571163 RepID=UPI002B6328FD|nr:questin oxidase family protein [Trinickia sp.]HTI16613.1 questin oxidase family protein [Trinickia sp.]